MSNKKSKQKFTVTAHRTDSDQYHCWVSDEEGVPEIFFEELERIEAKFFEADRQDDGVITDHLPVEGDYSHPPIDVGEVVFNSNDEIVDIQIDLEDAKNQLQSRGYL
ncbi:hypothetical protein [Halorubrum aidingense]|nr:hypothetical protein [Halorubrum aidingense]